MIRKIALAAICVCCSFANFAAAQNWQLTFDDEFNGDHVDTTKWSYGLPWGNHFNPGLDSSAYTLDNPDVNNPNVYVSGGFLHLAATHTPNAALDLTKNHAPFMQPYTSGCLTTVDKF